MSAMGPMGGQAKKATSITVMTDIDNHWHRKHLEHWTFYHKSIYMMKKNMDDLNRFFRPWTNRFSFFFCWTFLLHQAGLVRQKPVSNRRMPTRGRFICCLWRHRKRQKQRELLGFLHRFFFCSVQREKKAQSFLPFFWNQFLWYRCFAGWTLILSQLVIGPVSNHRRLTHFIYFLFSSGFKMGSYVRITYRRRTDLLKVRLVPLWCRVDTSQVCGKAWRWGRQCQLWRQWTQNFRREWLQVDTGGGTGWSVVA